MPTSYGRNQITDVAFQPFLRGFRLIITRVLSQTDAVGSVTRCEYDPLDNVTKNPDVLDNVTEKTYNSLNLLIWDDTRCNYDDAGRQIAVTAAGLRTDGISPAASAFFSNSWAVGKAALAVFEGILRDKQQTKGPQREKLFTLRTALTTRREGISTWKIGSGQRA